MKRKAPSQDEIVATCNSVRDLLLLKNTKYGDAALNPKRIFSRAKPTEQIRVRIDDKLSRIATMGEEDIDEDTARDLVGYLILLLVAKAREKNK